jgi:hypothetical protein
MIYSIPFELDKQRNIRFDARSIMLIEKQLDISIFKVNIDDLTLGDITVMLWAGLTHEDKSLTYDQALDLFSDTKTPTELFSALYDGIAEAFPHLKGNSPAIPEGNGQTAATPEVQPKPEQRTRTATSR